MAKLNLTLGEVRDLVGEGVIFGHADFVCRSIVRLDHAGPSDLSFVKGEKYFAAAEASRAGALVVPQALGGTQAHQLVLSDPHAGLARLLDWVAERQRGKATGIDPRATVAESASIGEGVAIGAGAVICEEAVVGDRAVIDANVFVGCRSVIGDDAVLHPNAVIREDVTVGQRTIVHAGAVIGSDGYSFVSDEHGHRRVPQVGGVVLGDDVEVGALATIDRATLDETVIGRGTKIGDMVHVGHNCRVGEDVLLLPFTAISGSVEVGDRAIFAGRSGSSDNLKIGAGARIGACSVAFKDIAAGETVWGNPARPKMEAMRIQVLLGELAEMRRELRELRADRKERKQG